jgi:hypothetical protein
VAIPEDEVAVPTSKTARPAVTGRWADRQIGRSLRRHWLFVLLFVLVLFLRVMATLAYQPVILFFDSPRYLGNIHKLDPQGENPLGYTLAAKLLLAATHHLMSLAVFNHVLGLAIAGLIYAVLLRRGVRPWLAALATLPVLLDALQLLIEEMAMSDTLFELLVVLGIVTLLWRPGPTVFTSGLAGLFLASAALTRYVGQALLLAGVLFVILAARRVGPRVLAAVALLVGFAMPMVAYAAYNDHVHGDFAVPTQAAAKRLYARMAVVADCKTLTLPAYERPLCPAPGVVKPRDGSLIQGYDNGITSPLLTYQPPKGKTESQVLIDFTKRVVRQQPLPLATAIGKTFVRPFVFWTRERRPGELPVDRFRFQGRFPLYFKGFTRTEVERYEGGPPHAQHTLARLLRGYQVYLGYTPGPVLGACLLLGLLGGFGVGRARRSGLQLACLLWVAVGAALLLAADICLFSWRYQLPALVTLPAAAAMGLTALLGPRDPAAGTGPRGGLASRQGRDEVTQDVGVGPGPTPDPGGETPGRGSEQGAPVT